MAERANVYPLRREAQRKPQPEPRPQEPLWREVLGRRLRTLRQDRQETLSETAARAGLSPQYLSEVERGRKEPSSEMIAALAGALGTTLIAQLLHLEADSADQEINLYVNCEGGDLPSMLAVYDTMQYIDAPVATTCVGQAIGVGAVLLAAGAPGRRSLLPHARVVLHQPAARGQGPIPDLILQADELVRMRAAIEDIMSAHTGQSVQTLRADTDRDRVLTARAALDYGIADQVLGQRQRDPRADKDRLTA